MTVAQFVRGVVRVGRLAGGPDGHVFTRAWPATAAEKVRDIPDRVIYYPVPQ